MEFAQACLIVATALSTRVQGSIIEHQQVQAAWIKAAPKCQEEIKKAVKKAELEQKKAQSAESTPAR